MRGRVGGLLALVVLAWTAVSPVAHGDDTTTTTITATTDPNTTTTDATATTSLPGSTTSSSLADITTTAPATLPDVPIEPAVRGTAYQHTPLPTTTTTVAPPPPVNAAPANSGSGRRAVYSKSRQRVWVIEEGNVVVRTYLVSGRLAQPPVGTFHVFSRSAYTCSINDSSTCMRYMVRFTKGPSGDNIGFHEIPRHNGVPMQSDAQLGQALSHGCVRQATADAQFMWGWAGIGTKVVVIA